MAKLIAGVDAGGIANRLGVRAGDTLVSINGEPVKDFVDYLALSQASHIEMLIRRGAEEFSYSFTKDDIEPLGMELAEPATRCCANKCVFCFVDQLPHNVRSSMRVKDDDWRMSLVMGNYVTLTNVPDAELERIIARRASPLYISVHAMQPELRSFMLGTPRAARITKQLKTLSDGGIEFHTQAVLCPGMNDGAALERTIAELAALPGALSLALVPVGLTVHREGLYPLKRYDAAGAKAVIDMADVWRSKLLAECGTRFVFPSDEFYLTAGIPLPGDAEYEDYAQIDDGVGMLRLLYTEYAEAYADVAQTPRASKRIVIACGAAASGFIAEMLNEMPVSGADIRVIPIRNDFFGECVNVSGLIVGRDLVAQLQGVRADAILITECMLRFAGDVFLDDMPRSEAETALNTRIVPVGRRGDELLGAIMNIVEA